MGKYNPNCARCRRNRLFRPDACPCLWSNKEIVKEWADMFNAILIVDEDWMSRFYEIGLLFHDE
jgi:hypothetical protein